jgi:hypothetical protein
VFHQIREYYNDKDLMTYESELTGRQQIDDPLLEITELDVVAGGDDTGLVEAAIELDDNLAVAVVVDFLVFADVA